jgi:multiple sugar transport system substrate-binding protein
VLKGFAVGALGLGTAGITGCSPFASKARSSGSENELELWHWETPPHRIEAFTKLFDRFTEETGITVNQQPINFPDYNTKLQAAVEADTLPDIAFANPTQVTMLQPQGFVLRLDDVFNEIHDKVRFFEKTYEEYTVEGSLWAVPLFGVVWPLTYRADLHEEAGFDGPPETWDDVLSRAEKLNGELPGYYQPISTNGNYGNQSIWGYLRNNGARIVAPGPAGEKEEVVFDSKETIETYEFLVQLSKYTGEGASNADWGSTELLMRSGEVQALIYSGSPIGDLVTRDNNKELAKKYAMTLVPRPDASGPTYNTGYARAAAVTTAAEERGRAEAAKEWLRWVTQPENHAEMLLANKALFMPVDEATTKAETWTEDSFNQEFQEIIDVQTEAMSHISVQGFEEGVWSSAAAAIENSRMTAAVLQKIILENQPVDEAVGWGQDQYENFVETSRM